MINMMKFLRNIIFITIFALPASALAVDGSFLIPTWTNPLPTSVYAFGDSIVVTGNWQLPPDWSGNIYVYQDAVLDAGDNMLTRGTQMSNLALQNKISINNLGGTATKTGTFSFDVGAQLAGAHNIHLEFWGGQTCAINKALNDLNGTSFVPVCPIDTNNAAFNIIWPVRKYTVGNPPFPTMTVTPDTDPAINFLNTELGSPTFRTFSVGNTGGETLNGFISGISAPFICTPSCNYVVNPGNSYTITIQYAPTVAPDSSNQNFLFSCAGSTLPCRKATTVSPVIVTDQPSETRRIVGNSVINSVSPVLSVTPGAVNYTTLYGTLNLGVTVPDQKFTVRNLGGGFLDGDVSFSIAGRYSCVGPCNYSIPSGSSRDIWIRYIPPFAGSFNDTATFNSTNGGGFQPISLLSDVNDKPLIRVGSNSLNFYTANGNRPVNVGSCLSITTFVQNIGSSMLNGAVTSIPVAVVPTNDASLNPGFTCTAGCTYNNLANGQWRNFTIQFCPTVAGLVTGSAILTNLLNPPNTALVSLSGQGNTAPIGGIGSPTILFGSSLLNVPKFITRTLSNTGVGVLSGTVDMSGAPGVFTCSSGCTYAIPAGGTHPVTFSFTPLLIQSYSGTVSLPGIANAPISGSGVFPDFKVSWGDWPATRCPGATCLDPQIKNYDIGNTTFTGNVNLAVQYKSFNIYSGNYGSGANVTYDFPSTAHFKCISGGWPYAVAAAGGCSGSLSWSGSGVGYHYQAPMYQFQPDAAGDYNEPLTITYDYGTGPQTKTINLIGHSISAPFLEVTPVSNVTFVPNPTLVGTAPSPRASYTVRNLGIGPMDFSVSGIPVGSPISCISNCSMTNVMPNDPQTVEFQYTPTAGISTMVTALFSSTGGNISRTLIGNGSVSPITALNPASIFYPDTNMGQYTNRTVRVTNAGLGTLSGIVTPVAPSGSDFFCIANCSYILTAGQSTNVFTDPVIQFRPINTGALSAVINFSGGTNGVQTVPVSGNAIFAPIIDIRGSDTNFGDVVVDKYKERIFTIKNTGTADLGTGTFSVTGPFTCVNPVDVGDGLCHYSLNAGTEAVITIRFSPTVIGDASGVVSLSGVPLARFFVNGRGVPPSFQFKEQ